MAKARAMDKPLKELGLTTIGVDAVTKARLKRLAGDTPLCVKVKELVEAAEDKPGQLGLPGQERLTSKNTLSAVNSRLDTLTGQLNAVMTFMFGGDPTVTQQQNREQLIIALASAISRLESVKVDLVNRQLDLNMQVEGA